MNVVVFSTVHPGVLPYVGAWYSSVRKQRGAPPFSLHIALDAVTPSELNVAAGTVVNAEFTTASPGDTPAGVRQRGWENICNRFDVAVLVDADDLLRPTRVAAAVKGLESVDVYGCALDLVDAMGAPLGRTFGVPTRADGPRWATSIAYQNVFGLSNTAYRMPFLAGALPLPTDVQAVDWYLVTSAIGAGATIVFDDVPRMAYRQHDDNIGRVLPPFDLAFLERASEVVVHHHGRILERWPDEDPPPGRRCFERRLRDVRVFTEAMQDEDVARRYVQALNRPVRDVYAWWQMVAMPELESLWNP